MLIFRNERNNLYNRRTCKWFYCFSFRQIEPHICTAHSINFFNSYHRTNEKILHHETIVVQPARGMKIDPRSMKQATLTLRKRSERSQDYRSISAI